MQRGFSLVTAIFLLVVMASLGALMMTFVSTQQQSSALDVVGANAYQVARTGIEWGAYQITSNATGSFATTCQAGTTSVSSVPLTGTPSLGIFTLVVSCSTNPSKYAEGLDQYWVYSISSVASSVNAAVGSSDYIERELHATISSGVFAATTVSGISYQRENY